MLSLPHDVAVGGLVPPEPGADSRLLQARALDNAEESAADDHRNPHADALHGGVGQPSRVGTPQSRSRVIARGCNSLANCSGGWQFGRQSGAGRQPLLQLPDGASRSKVLGLHELQHLLVDAASHGRQVGRVEPGVAVVALVAPRTSKRRAGALDVAVGGVRGRDEIAPNAANHHVAVAVERGDQFWTTARWLRRGRLRVYRCAGGGRGLRGRRR